MGITLSKKHGVNPAIPLCFYCNEPKNEIVLAGRLKDDAEAPKAVVWDKVPCDKCQEHMKAGILCISVDAKLSEKDHSNPYRTGGWVVITEEAVRRIFSGKVLEDTLKWRVCFMEDEVWKAIGLPLEGVKEVG